MVTHLARTVSDMAQASKLLQDAEAQQRRADSPEKKTEAAEAAALAKQIVADCEQLLQNTIGARALATARVV